MVAWFNTIGLVLTLVGVVLLFRYGMPYRVRTGGAGLLLTADSEDKKTEERASVLGWIGLALITVGTVLQIAANWPHLLL